MRLPCWCAVRLASRRLAQRFGLVPSEVCPTGPAEVAQKAFMRI